MSYDWYDIHYVYGSSETWPVATEQSRPDYAICINGFSGPGIGKPREFYSINGTLASLVAENFSTRLRSTLWRARLDFLIPSGRSSKRKKRKREREISCLRKTNRRRLGFVAREASRKSEDINLITITPRRSPYTHSQWHDKSEISLPLLDICINYSESQMYTARVRGIKYRENASAIRYFDF